MGVEFPERSRMFVGGDWVESRGGEWIEVLNPATGALLSSVPAAGAEDVDHAVRTAHEAFPAWSRTTPEERSEILVVIGGGCCDNTAPMLLKDSRLGAADVRMGDVDGVPVYCEPEQARLMAASHLEIGVSSGGGNSFSLEISLGKRFVLKTS